MHSGKAIRLSRILRPQSGNGIVVALDHGLFLGPIPGVERIVEVMAKMTEGCPDALQVSPGTARASSELFLGHHTPALIVRIDASNIWRSVQPPKEGYHAQVATVQEAVALGADAVVAFFFVGYESDLQEAHNLEFLGRLTQDCRTYGIPLIVEPLGIAKGSHLVNDPEKVKLAVRVAAEAGADVIKADYTGSPKTFKPIVEACTVPLLIRGGPKTENDEQALTMVKDALTCGARGLVFGRNVWQHPNPPAMLHALSAIVHDKASVASAAALLKESIGSGSRSSIRNPKSGTTEESPRGTRQGSGIRN